MLLMWGDTYTHTRKTVHERFGIYIKCVCSVCVCVQTSQSAHRERLRRDVCRPRSVSVCVFARLNDTHTAEPSVSSHRVVVRSM